MKRRQELSSSLRDDLHVFELAPSDTPVDERRLLERMRQVRGVQRAEYNAARRRLLLLGAVDRRQVLVALEEIGLAEAAPAGTPENDPAEAQDELVAAEGPKVAPDRSQRVALDRRALVAVAVLLPVSFLAGVALSVIRTGPVPQVSSGRLLGFAVAAAAAALVAAQVLYANRAAAQAIGTWRQDTALVTLIVVAALGVSGDWAGAALLCLAVWVLQGVPWLLLRRLQRSYTAVHMRLPDRVRVVVGEEERFIPRTEAEVGLRVRVLEGETVPLDGRVASGEAAVDASAVTGEAIPFAPVPGQVVLAGSKLLSGTLDLDVLRPAQGAWLAAARPQEVWEHAGDAAALGRASVVLRRWPMVIVYTATALMALPTLLLGEAVDPWLRRALALLVVAPVNTLVVARIAPQLLARIRTAREGGILGAEVLAGLGRVQRVVVTADTLLDPRCTVAGLEPLGGLRADEALRLAASVSARWEHPLGRAVYAATKRDRVVPAEPVSSTVERGLGVRAAFNENGVLAEYILGLTAWVRAEGVHLPAETDEWTAMAAREGGTIVWLARGAEPLAALMVEQRLRDGVRRLVGRIRRTGVRRITLVGPYDRACLERWADQAGIDEVVPELLPAAADDAVSGWRTAGEGVAAVVSVWDQADALSSADVRLVLSAGEHTAPQANTVLLPSEDPFRVYTLLRLGRRSRRTALGCGAAAATVKALQTVAALVAAPAPWLLAAADVAVMAFVTIAALALLQRW